MGEKQKIAKQIPFLVSSPRPYCWEFRRHRAKLWKHYHGMYTESPWPNSWSPGMPMFCLAVSADLNRGHMGFLSNRAWEHLRDLPQESLKEQLGKSCKAYTCGEGRQAYKWSLRSKQLSKNNFLLVLIKINWSYLELKVYIYIYLQVPCLCEEAFIPVFLILDSWVGAENY